MGIAYMAFNTRHIRRRGNFDDLIGKEARVVKVNSKNKCKGMAEVHGEIWKIKSDSELTVDHNVEVIDHKGLTLKVKLKGDLNV